MPSLAEITQLCRLCLVKDQVNIPIFNGQGDIQQIFHKISTCLPVKISQEDGLPKNICDGCSHKLDMFYQFWNTSSNSEKQLLQWLKEIERSLSLEKDASVQQSHSICPDDDVVLKQEAIDIDEHNADDGIPTDDLNVPTDPDYLLQQSYGSFDYQQEAYNEEAATSNAAGPSSTVTSETAAVAAPKRKRRAAAMKPLPPQINSEDEDDPDAVETKIAKTEKLSDDEDESNPEPTTFVGLPTDNEQPGPSGVDKVTGEAPSVINTTNQPNVIMWIPQSKLHEYNVQRVWKCHMCTKYFEEKRRLTRHLKIHTVERLFHCEVCAKSYKTKHEARQHRVMVHENVGYACDVCPKRLRTKMGLSSHKNRHAMNQTVFCPTCDKGFYSTWEMKKHILRDHENASYTCEVCGKPLKDVSYIKRHMKLHEPEALNSKKYQCDMCSKDFKLERSLLLHQQVHRGKMKKHVCYICGKILSSSSSLKDHIIMHEGLKPEKCKECGKAFARHRNLEVHMRLHTGVKPYHCGVCSKSFTQRPSLKIHMRIHSGEKPYNCSICEVRFISKSSLNVHLKNKHNTLSQ